MKDLNDFINRVNQTRGRIRQMSRNNALVDDYSNRTMVQEINGDYEDLTDKLKNTEKEVEKTSKKISAKAKTKGRKK